MMLIIARIMTPGGVKRSYEGGNDTGNRDVCVGHGWLLIINAS